MNTTEWNQSFTTANIHCNSNKNINNHKTRDQTYVDHVNKNEIQYNRNKS